LPQVPENAEIADAYANLKAKLTENGCQIISEKAHRTVTVVQGSIWGTTPKTAKKRITYTLTQDAQGTHIQTATHLTRGYVNFTVVGVAASALLLAVCAWIALDLQDNAGFWSWLATVGGVFDSQKAALFAMLTTALAVFLAVSMSVEAYIVWKVWLGIRAFAEEMAATCLPNGKPASSPATSPNRN
jgi:hypothetical protein